MLAPLSRRGSAYESVSATFSPPVGGWNARDAFGDMAREDAILMDNWFPRTNDVALRNGYAEHCDTAEAASVVGLEAWNAGSSSKLIAFVNGKAIDATTDTPATLTTGLNAGAEVFGFQFKAHGFYLNGQDAVQSYDGTTFGSAGWAKDAGESETFDATALTVGMGFSNRVYMGGDGKLGFWYGTVNAVTGAVLFFFPLDGVMGKGGELVAMGAITDDDGAGRNDFAVFISSEGQVAIYQGSDPGDASGWAIVGVYDIGEPVSRFGLVKYGADLVVLVRDGYIPLSSVIAGNFGKSRRYALSDKIVSEAANVIERYKNNTGWRVLAYPKGSMLIVNVPRTPTQYDQHVMNTVTGAWCRFRSIPATSWAIFGQAAYFGSTDGKIYLFDNGSTDNGAGINGDLKTAWSGFGTRNRKKQFVMARPIFISDSNPQIELSFAVDFHDYVATGSISAALAGSTAIWDQAIWDQNTWAGVQTAADEWIALQGLGYLGSLRAQIGAAMANIAWTQITVMAKVAGPR